MASNIYWPITNPRAIPRPAEKASPTSIPRLHMLHCNGRAVDIIKILENKKYIVVSSQNIF
jgi:hypothetical protein